MTNDNSYIIDVTDQTFAAAVLDRSQTMPVVVDFWAAWCAPCRTLGPVLEKLAAEYEGAFILAKLDVDQNQQMARRYGVQGIPAVKAFYNGQMVGEFTGALPEEEVRQFLGQLIPSDADQHAQQGYNWEVAGQLPQAVESYRAALTAQSDHYPARVGLGRSLMKLGQVDEALEILEPIPAGVPARSRADALIALAQFNREARGENEAELRAKIETDPSDVAARYTLAALLVTQQNFTEALEHFLEIVRRDRSYREDAARKAMLALFTIIGEQDPISREYRQKLANTLF